MCLSGVLLHTAAAAWRTVSLNRVKTDMQPNTHLYPSNYVVHCESCRYSKYNLIHLAFFFFVKHVGVSCWFCSSCRKQISTGCCMSRPLVECISGRQKLERHYFNLSSSEHGKKSAFRLHILSGSDSESAYSALAQRELLEPLRQLITQWTGCYSACLSAL